MGAGPDGVNAVAFLVAGTMLVAAVAHAWVGTRQILPRLFVLPEFREVLTPTPGVRRTFLVAWQMGTLAILAFAAFLPILRVLEHREAAIRLFVFGILVLVTGSLMIVGTYLGLLLRARTRHFGIWFTLALWAVLAIVVTAAWRAAER